MTAVAAVAYAIETPMIVQSDLLGPITLQQEDLITFPSGLLGFPECRTFVLVPSEREGMYWLQSAEYSPLAFLLVDPFLHVQGFEVALKPADLAELGAEPASEIAILAIVTLPRTRQELCTANLQGPLAFNLAGQRAKQLVIPDSAYGVRSELDLSQATRSA